MKYHAAHMQLLSPLRHLLQGSFHDYPSDTFLVQIPSSVGNLTTCRFTINARYIPYLSLVNTPLTIWTCVMCSLPSDTGAGIVQGCYLNSAGPQIPARHATLMSV
jgi:hypothetical protein